MITENNGGNVYAGNDMPHSYDFTVHYTNSGRVEHWYFTDGQVSLKEDYGDPASLKWKKQKKRTQKVWKQKYNYQKKYVGLLSEHLLLQNKYLTLQDRFIALQKKHIDSLNELGDLQTKHLALLREKETRLQKQLNKETWIQKQIDRIKNRGNK